jgi:serine/threonine protein phosphatase 1
MRTYATTDIHGRLDLLLAALRAIEAENPSAYRLIVTGDLIDRGHRSKQVLDVLMQGPRRAGDEWIVLAGNHEQMMVHGLENPGRADWRMWLNLGGDATLRSFNGPVPDRYAEWLKRLPLSYETEHHFFVHAGINPGRPLSEQRPNELLWIRDLFLGCDFAFEKHIVHGHTPRKEPELLHNRTNLDVGSMWTGRLAVARFDLTKPGGPENVFIVTGE